MSFPGADWPEAEGGGGADSGPGGSQWVWQEHHCSAAAEVL